MAVNLADLFEHAVDAFPARTALICGDQQVTYAQLEERANRLAHYLAGAGVGHGDHVGLFARNSLAAVETILAACKLRAAAININYRFTGPELRYMLEDSDIVALVHDRDLTPLAQAQDGVPGLRARIVIGDGPAGTGPVDEGPVDEDPVDEGPVDEDPVDSTALPAGAVSYEQALAGGAPDRDFPPRGADDVYVIYTGGTTGYPKGVMWRHEDIWRTLAGGIDFSTGVPLKDEWQQSRLGARSGGVSKLTVAPLIHGAAQVSVLGAFFTGDTVVLMRRFDADEIWRAVERHKVKMLMVIGDAMARPLIDAYTRGGYDASSLAAVTSSGALFSAGVKEECARALPGVFFTDAVGSTETGFTGMGVATADAARRGGPTVKPGPGTIVLDDENQPAKPGQTGRLARGGHVPLGYYKDPEKTAALFAEVGGERYAVPGDMARVEDDGSITLLGRGKTCVNTGGEKVFPEEVEDALKSHPDVFDAVVVGVPDERLGQRVAALIQPRTETGTGADNSNKSARVGHIDNSSKGARELDLDALTEYLRGRIAGYKVPRSVWVVGQISRTAVGKPDYGWINREIDRQMGQSGHSPDESGKHPDTE